MRPEVSFTPLRRTRRWMAGLVLPWMLWRRIFVWRLAPLNWCVDRVSLACRHYCLLGQHLTRCQGPDSKSGLQMATAFSFLQLYRPGPKTQSADHSLTSTSQSGTPSPQVFCESRAWSSFSASKPKPTSTYLKTTGPGQPKLTLSTPSNYELLIYTTRFCFLLFPPSPLHCP